jgi:ADP-sugar diphosphatase
MSFSNDIVTPSSAVPADVFAKVLACPQFNDWKSKQSPAFTYHSVVIDKVTMFGPNPGLIYITTDVTFNGLRSSRAVFIRGGAIGIYFRFRSKQTGKLYSLYVRQPRNAVGDPALAELVAGMLDGASGTLKSNGVAAKEIKEETGIEIQKSDLVWLGRMLPSAGGCDEWLDLYSVFLEADDDYIMALIGKHTGELGSDEQITLGIAEVEEFKSMLLDGRCQDAKAMSAIMLLDAKIARGYDDQPSRSL